MILWVFVFNLFTTLLNELKFLKTILAAKLMHQHKAHGSTDVTGFGLVGHAENLVRVQKNNVSFRIHTLPCLSGTQKISRILNDRFKLFRGLSPETSGRFSYFKLRKLILFCSLIS